jgi:hypothetical protein
LERRPVPVVVSDLMGGLSPATVPDRPSGMVAAQVVRMYVP